VRFRLAALAAVPIALALAPAGASAAKLKLSVASLGNPPASAAPGTSFTVAYNVTRQGSGLRKATLVVYLSPAKRKARGAIALRGTAPLAALARRRSLRGKVALAVPATVASASYFLVACVEQVKGTGARRAGGCRVAASKVAVAAPHGTHGPGLAPPAPPAPGGGGGGGGSGGSGGAAAIDTTVPPFVPAPQNVTPVLDGARAVTETVPADGGTLEATGADGTVYTLDIPFGALTDSEEITMTPLSGIAGLPFTDGHGVQLEPDGLTLTGPATLSIVPTAPVPLAQQAAFSYLGDGADLHLYATSLREDVFEYQLLHFSAYGYGKGTAADREAQSKRVPSDREAWARQNLARAAHERAIAMKEGRESDTAQWLAAFGVAWFIWGNEGIRAALTDAKTNDALFEDAESEFGSWFHEGALLAMHEEYPELVSELEALFLEAAEFFSDRAAQRCLQNKDVFQAWRMLRIERALQLLGASTTTTEELLVKMDKCARLDLEIAWSFTFEPDDLQPPNATGTSSGTLLFHIRPFDPDGPSAESAQTSAPPQLGAATLVFDDSDYTWSWTGQQVTRDSVVRGPTIDWRWPNQRGEPRAPIVALPIDWGGISVTGTYRQCSGGSGCFTVPDFPGGIYNLAINALYGEEIRAEGRATIRRWEIHTGVGNEVFATKEIDREVHSDLQAGTGTEELEFRLLHKPEP
jgi:hypothetical protein